MQPNQPLHIHLISDSTGETLHSLARACLAQFPDAQVREHFWNMVRSQRQLDIACEEIDRHGGLVVFTLIQKDLRRSLENFCRRRGLHAVPVMDPLVHVLSHHLGQRQVARPGGQHSLDAAYYSRIEAMEFAIAHDDGQSAETLHEADIILVGVSRTSKTPTCLYLANRGLRTGNVPYVPGSPLELPASGDGGPLIVGLTKDPERLVQLRRNRLRELHQTMSSAYVDPEEVREELREARRYFARNGWPVVDVSRRAIEETAAEILVLWDRRRPDDTDPPDAGGGGPS